MLSQSTKMSMKYTNMFYKTNTRTNPQNDVAKHKTAEQLKNETTKSVLKNKTSPEQNRKQNRETKQLNNKHLVCLKI
jgi:hypothetical protein